MSSHSYDQRTEENIDSLQPEFADRGRQWLAECRKEGLNPLIHYGARKPSEQQAPHDKYLAHKGPKAVDPKRSYHCYGRAFDWANITDSNAGEAGLKWDDNHAYAKGTQIGAPFEIEGIGSEDNDHLQDAKYPGYADLPPGDYGHFPTVVA